MGLVMFRLAGLSDGEERSRSAMSDEERGNDAEE
jgi:hypothetical protein